MWLPLIADVAGVTVAPTAEVDGLDDAFRADRLGDAVGEVVRAIAGSGAAIVVEDAHWLDDASQALVATLGRLLGEKESLLITRRPGGAATPGCEGHRARADRRGERRRARAAGAAGEPRQ